MKKAKHWYDYLWICATLYFTLGFFNILFAWLGMIDFLLPLFLAIFGGNKFFCPLSLTVLPYGTAWSFTRKPGTPSLQGRLTRHSP